MLCVKDQGHLKEPHRIPQLHQLIEESATTPCDGHRKSVTNDAFMFSFFCCKPPAAHEAEVQREALFSLSSRSLEHSSCETGQRTWPLRLQRPARDRSVENVIANWRVILEQTKQRKDPGDFKQAVKRIGRRFVAKASTSVSFKTYHHGTLVAHIGLFV